MELVLKHKKTGNERWKKLADLGKSEHDPNLRKELWMDQESGSVAVRQKEDLSNFFREVQHWQSEAPKLHGQAAYRLSYQLPRSLFYAWAYECGHPANSREHMDYVRWKLKTGDYSRFMVRGF